ncbi:hypothetical protein GPECTOR_104g89 [Gonium pectorale]|uniref:Ion transport domain-containing protein n=1 Tax=Gonium pectorale TaxID=33097 RepID=A0A150FZN9_GONPE|nr:hypothetical protein GPECTOR_104g89 [Gonium pectorale]|eukprot:KXZ43083.1 hypothetical protein GPECTOR_104g89 [Gonium pectorale]
MFDTAQIILMALFLGLHWSCAVPVVVIRCLAAALVLVLFWRMLGYMMVMEGLGNFVRMVQEVTWDLRWFFVFLGFIFAGFTLSILVLAVDLSPGQGSDSDGPRHPIFVLVLVRLYTMMYSNFDPDILLDPDSGAAAAVTSLSAVVCSIFMMFVSIILLNLLIAVIGDAYDRVSYDREVNRMKSKAALVVEVDLLLPRWFRKQCDETFFHASHGHVVMILQEERRLEPAEGGKAPTPVSAPPAVHGSSEPSGTAEVAWVAESTGRLGVMKALIGSGMANTQAAVSGMQVAVREQKVQLDALKEQLDKLQGLDMGARLDAMQTKVSELGTTQLRALEAVRTMQEQLSRLCEQLQAARPAAEDREAAATAVRAEPSAPSNTTSGQERVEPAARGRSNHRRRQANTPPPVEEERLNS